MPQRETQPALLRIEDLGVAFGSGPGRLQVLDGVSLEISPGQSFGMLGETGAGKSLTAWATIGLLPFGAELTSGTIRYGDRDLTSLSEAEMRSLRGREIAIVLQNPRAALTPTARIGDQMVNACTAHRDCTKDEARERVIEGLRDVGIPDPERRARGYAHELSIGMAQRVVIAIALLHDPKLLIADEPTSGLDVTIQAEVLDLLSELVREKGTALWLITHDLGVIANYCDAAVVMFAGEVVERCSIADLFRSPRHPYVKGLLDSRLTAGTKGERLNISGAPPDLTRLEQGCRFAYRCPWVEQRCRERTPHLEEVVEGHETRCWVAQDAAAGRGDGGHRGGRASVAEVRR
jgi:peptide/nickel transport system ATP-binding protein